MKFIIKKYSKYLILILLMYMPIFGHLNTLPIQIWDEARLAINAYEMHKNGDHIITYFEGTPDMWNTKPPLLIWVQSFLMKVLGVNELAVRLPSAIAAFLTGVALLILALWYFKDFWFGFIAVIVLITSQGYIDLHAARTGDYDALLTLFTTLSCLFFFAFTETQKFRFLYLFFLATALGVLTKSVTGLLFLPAIFVYGITQKQILSLLKSKHFYIGLLGFIGLVAGYYLIREAHNPGYLAAVQENELGGRFLEVIEEHHAGFWFYYNNFIDLKLTYWYLLVPCGLAMGFAIKNKKINRITWFSFLMMTTFFLIISTSKTKLGWYDVPLYPFLSIVVAVFIYTIYQWLSDSKLINQSLSINVVPFLFLFLVTITPYQKILDKTFKPKEYDSDIEFYEIGYYLKDAIKGKHDLNHQYLLYDGYSAQNLFYLKILNDKGVQVSFKDWTKLEPNEVVFAHQKHVKQYVEDHYLYEITHTNKNIVAYKINGQKK